MFLQDSREIGLHKLSATVGAEVANAASLLLFDHGNPSLERGCGLILGCKVYGPGVARVVICDDKRVAPLSADGGDFHGTHKVCVDTLEKFHSSGFRRRGLECTVFVLAGNAPRAHVLRGVR